MIDYFAPCNGRTEALLTVSSIKTLNTFNKHWSCYIFSYTAGWLRTHSEVKPSSYIQIPPQLGGFALPSGLPFARHTTIISAKSSSKRHVCFSFRFELFAEGLCTEYNHCQPGLILTIGCQATPAPQRPFLEPLYSGTRAVHDSVRLKSIDVSIQSDCKWVALTHRT